MDRGQPAPRAPYGRSVPSTAIRRDRARRKTFDHPELGELTFDCDALAVQGTALQLIVYTATKPLESLL